MLADGCFVFKWNKAIDIKEPTQKAIIVHDAGREDLLLQVKYQGPLEEFGWLIPVPSLPKVEKGSMEPFYELSQLTQRQFGTGTRRFATLGVANDSSEAAVKVVEIKTVGAYEVAVLSAQDSDSLARWLREHDYSLPDGKSEIVNDYVRRGWYFIAAKIQLNKGVAFKTVSTTSPADSEASSKARKALRKDLASGELHPLLITFDTPKCVFPLRISAMNGKPSEVSLYVLSAEPLLEHFTFGQACAKLERSHAEWIAQKPQRIRAREKAMENSRSMGIAAMMRGPYSPGRTTEESSRARNWSTEDLNALAREMVWPLPDEALGDAFYAAPEELLPCMRLEPGRIPKSSKVLSRLKGGNWHLTKLVWTFTPEEMRDLEFESAVPALKQVLPKEFASVAAELLARFGGEAALSLVTACKNTNATERLNVLCGLERTHGVIPTESLLLLLKDDAPQVRLHAARCAEANWDPRFVDPLIALLRDLHLEIRQEASGCLGHHESTNRTSFYLELLNDSDAKVRMQALGIASWINRYAPSDEVFRAALQALKDPNEDVQSSALHVLVRNHKLAIPKADLLPLLNSSRCDTVLAAASFLRWGRRNSSPGATRRTSL